MFKQFNVVDMIKKNKAAVIIGSIISFIIGILCIIAPFESGGVLVWAMIVLSGVLGIASIIKFIVPGKGNDRNPTSLVMGIVVVICVVAILLIGLLGKSEVIQGTTYTSMQLTTIRILGFSSVFFGVFSTVNNIFLLCTIGNVPSNMKGFVIARSIFGIIIGILMVVFPFVMFTISVFLGGIYLVITAIVGIVAVIKLSKE